jgi:serine/threonine protein kinase
VATQEETQAPESIGNYDIVSKIAEGGMGAVYRAKSRATGNMVAIKIVPAQTAKNKTLLRRFEREFNAAHGIDHVNVVKAIEFCSEVATPFLVMELVDGDSVGQRIDKVGKFTEEEAKRIIIQVCQGLHRAHKHNLIHRDIKPDNILLAPDGTAKITDLGLVKGLGEEEMNLTRTGRGLGTPHFMAPEQFRDAKNADVRCDVYSVGATMYMMVTGVMPFDGSGPLDCWMKKIRNEFPPPRELTPELSHRTNDTIMRAMSATPERRHSTCREFVEDLLGRSTRPADAAQKPENTELWYLVYKDEIGQSHTVKGTTDGIRKALQDHLLGDARNIVAAKSKQGPFQSMEKLAEFRDLMMPDPLPSKTPLQYPLRGEPPPPTPDQRAPRSSGYAATDGTTLDYMPAYDGPELPHIQLDRPARPNTEWLLWALVCFLACMTGVAVYLRFLK